jgi:hypothetical protein
VRIWRLVVAVACCLVIIGVAHAQASVTVQVGEISGAPGSEVRVPVELKGASNVGALHVEIVYDPTIITAKKVENATGGLLEANVSQPGRVVVGLVTTEGLNGDVTVADVVFEVKGKEGDRSDLRLEKVEANDATSLAALTVNMNNGRLQVAAGAPQAEGGGDDTGLVVLIIVVVVVILAAVGMGLYQFARRTAGAGAARAMLYVMSGNAYPRQLPLRKNVVALGRQRGSDLLVDDERVSRSHAQIVRQGGLYLLMDLNSTNGTRVNGVAIQSHQLKHGDVIELGSATIRFVLQ